MESPQNKVSKSKEGDKRRKASDMHVAEEDANRDAELKLQLAKNKIKEEKQLEVLGEVIKSLTRFCMRRKYIYREVKDGLEEAENCLNNIRRRRSDGSRLKEELAKEVVLSRTNLLLDVSRRRDSMTNSLRYVVSKSRREEKEVPNQSKIQRDT